jgi:hypothetical protein
MPRRVVACIYIYMVCVLLLAALASTQVYTSLLHQPSLGCIKYSPMYYMLVQLHLREQQSLLYISSIAQLFLRLSALMILYFHPLYILVIKCRAAMTEEQRSKSPILRNLKGKGTEQGLRSVMRQ